MGIAGHRARHPCTGSAVWGELPFGPGKHFALGALQMGTVQLVLSEVGGFGLFLCSLLLGPSERKQLLLAAVRLDIWQITPVYTVKKPKGQMGRQGTGAANAEQPRCVFLLGHLLVQRLGKVVCVRAVFCFGGFWHPFPVLEEGWCDVGTGRASSVLTSPSWPGLSWMLIKHACPTPETCSKSFSWFWEAQAFARQQGAVSEGWWLEGGKPPSLCSLHHAPQLSYVLLPCIPG